MTYDEKEDFDSFFDDDSSAEDELVRVAEKLETMHREEETMKTNVIIPNGGNIHVPLHPPAYNRRQGSELTSFEYESDSTPSLDKATKHVSTTSRMNNAKDSEMRRNNYDEKSDKRNNSSFSSSGGSEGRRQSQDLEGLLPDGTINDDASAKKDSVREHHGNNRREKQIVVDLTNIQSTSLSSSDDGSSASESDHDEIGTDKSERSTSLSSSPTISNAFGEVFGATENPLSQKTAQDIRMNTHRADILPRSESQHDSIVKPSRATTLTDPVLRKTETEMRTNVLETNESHHNERMGHMPSFRKSARSKHVLRNPYLKRKSQDIGGSNQTGKNNRLELEEFHESDEGKNGKTQSPTSELPEDIEVASVDRTDMKREETIVIDSQGLEEEAKPEISRLLYAPPVYRKARPTPILHRYDRQSHPMDSRQSIPVKTLDHMLTSGIVKSFWARKFNSFNHFQSVLVDTLSSSDASVVVSAPTGAGKSTVFELAMARFFSVDLKAQEHQGAPSVRVSNARKIVYIAPSKALCEERYEDWLRKLEHMNLGLEVALITGQEIGSEQAATSFSDLIAAHLIVTTPEKWDSMTRRWNESFFLFASVKLLLLDEVHLLGDESRGWCLESIITRMKTIQRAASSLTTTSLEISNSSYAETNPDALASAFRTVAVSATLPNILEVAEFLESKEAYSFDDTYRPVPLTKHVISLGRVGKNEWRFWSNLSEHVPEIIRRFSHGKQSLIFCHSKKETQKVAELLIQRNFGNPGVRKVSSPWSEPVEYMLGHGIGYHHAGMSKDDKKKIEDAFLNKKIKCLAATSTLAVGVNLPAHLVIILGTKAWRNTEKGKGYQEIEVSSLLQMIGRAGRPGLDSAGVAVVLTDNCSKKNIEGLLEAGVGPAKSNLVPRLPEVLNSEISQGVITSMDEMLRWLQTTFLFSCLNSNNNVIPVLERMGNESITDLRKISLVEISPRNSIRPLAGSYIMNRYLVSFEQMKSITDFRFDVSQCQILRSMSKLDNFQSFVKRNEKRELKEFHRTDLMKYKLPGPLSKFIVRDPSEKSFILLQSFISRHRFKNLMLNDEQIAVRDEAIKFLEVAQEYCVKSSKHGKVALECYKLQRSLNYALWGESSGVFNQFEWIGSSKATSNALKFNGIRSFQDVLHVSEQKLDEIFAKSRLFGLPKSAGRVVKHTVGDLCRHTLRLSTDIEYTKNSRKPSDLICSLKFNYPSSAMTQEKREQELNFSLIAYTDSSENSLLIFEEKICSPSTFRVPLPSKSFKQIFVHLIGSWIGFDQKVVIDGIDAPVSSQETSIRSLQNYRRSRLLVKSTADMKKRPLPTESTGRPKEKRQCTTIAASKKPSPVTPQPQHHNQEISPSYTNSTHPREAFQMSKGTTSSSYAPSPPGLLNGLHSDFMTVTPTRRSTNEMKLPLDLVEDNFITSVKKTGCTEKYDLEVWPKHDESPASDTFEEAQAFKIHATSHKLGEEQRISSFHGSNGPIQSTEYLPYRKAPYEIREKTVWNKSRKKQQKAQQRAFTEKNMNPFRAFSHDPNDTERHLEQLSQNSSIIPIPLRAKMKQSSIASNRKSQHHGSTCPNHRTRTVRRFLNQNPQQVLREKASEHQFQHDQMILSNQQDISNYYCHGKDYESQYFTSRNAWKDHAESFQHTHRRTYYPPLYPNSDRRQSQFRSPVSSESPHFTQRERFTQREDRIETCPTTRDNSYKPLTTSIYQNSNFPGSSGGEVFKTRQSYGQPLFNEYNEDAGMHMNDRSHYQSIGGNSQPHHRLSYSNIDFDCDF